VIAIILIIITIAVPKYQKTQMFMRRPRHQGHPDHSPDGSAVPVQYGRYAASLAELGPPASGAANPSARPDGNDLAGGEKQATSSPSPETPVVT